MNVDYIYPQIMKSILLTNIEHFILRSNPSFKYINHFEIVPKNPYFSVKSLKNPKVLQKYS